MIQQDLGETHFKKRNIYEGIVWDSKGFSIYEDLMIRWWIAGSSELTKNCQKTERLFY